MQLERLKSRIATTAAAQGLLARPPRHALGFDGEGEGLSKEESDKLKRSIAEKDKEVRKLQQEKKDTDARIDELEKKLEDASAGDDDKAKLEQRLDRLEKQSKKAEERAENAENELAAEKRNRTAIEIASRLNFRNPARAIKLLDSDDLDNEDDTERALEALAREEPGMVTSKRTRPVEDPKPKKKGGKGGDGDEDDDEDGKKPKSGDDEPKGVSRLRNYYDKQEKKRKGEGDDDGEGGGESD